MLKRLMIALLAISSVGFAENLEQAVDGYLAAADPAPAPSLWNASGSLGLTITDGNSDTKTLALGAEADRAWDPWHLFLKLSSIYAESEGDETANEQILTERLERALDEKASLFQDLLLEHDEQEDLSYRIQLTFGYKRKLIEKKDFELFGEAGAGILHEEFRTDTQDEAILQFAVSFKWQITKQLLFTQIVTIWPSLSETGEFRLTSESNFTTPIGERLDLRFSIVDRYDSNPPAGVTENDLQVTLSLVIRFTPKKK